MYERRILVSGNISIEWHFCGIRLRSVTFKSAGCFFNTRLSNGYPRLSKWLVSYLAIMGLELHMY